MFRQDFIKRQIELLAQAIASIMRKRSDGDSEGALAEAQQAYGLLGIDAGLLRLDARSLIALVGDRQKLNGLIELLEAEASIRAALGQIEKASELSTRARELRS